MKNVGSGWNERTKEHERGEVVSKDIQNNGMNVIQSFVSLLQMNVERMCFLCNSPAPFQCLSQIMHELDEVKKMEEVYVCICIHQYVHMFMSPCSFIYVSKSKISHVEILYIYFLLLLLS